MANNNSSDFYVSLSELRNNYEQILCENESLKIINSNLRRRLAVADDEISQLKSEQKASNKVNQEGPKLFINLVDEEESGESNVLVPDTCPVNPVQPRDNDHQDFDPDETRLDDSDIQMFEIDDENNQNRSGKHPNNSDMDGTKENRIVINDVENETSESDDANRTSESDSANRTSERDDENRTSESDDEDQTSESDDENRNLGNDDVNQTPGNDKENQVGESDKNIENRSKVNEQGYAKYLDLVDENKDDDVKYIGPVVRKKKDRMELDGFDCEECREYYKAAELTDSQLKSRLQKCSRHRAKFARASTPEGYWDLGIPKENLPVTEDDSNPHVSKKKRPLCMPEKEWKF